jgi:two-component system phosphate regulon sensor histidine kinase PhoR
MTALEPEPAAGAAILSSALRRPSRNRARSRSIWLWQLSLAAGVITISLVAAIIIPDIYSYVPFVIGSLMIAAITTLTMGLPWRRLPARAVLAIPLLDIIAIGFISYGGVYRLSYLWIFPIAWVATYYSLRWVVAAIGTVAVLLAIDAFTFAAEPMTVQRLLVIVLSLSFLAVCIYSVARHARALRNILTRQADRLRQTLDRTREQAARTTQMFDSLDVAVARVSSRGEILAVNEAYRELYALDANDLSLPGGSVEYDAERGEALAASDRPLARATRGELTDGERVWLYDPDGNWHVLTVSTRPLPPGDGVHSTVLIVQDVSDLHRAERERKTLAATVSHELRNPLTAALAHTELLLERDDLPQRAREQIALIEAAGERMLHLVTQTIETTIDIAPKHVDRSRVDVRRVLDASIESFTPAVAAAGVHVTIEAPAQISMDADAFRLRQVFDNLLANAVKYSRADDRVSISAQADATTVRLAISDTGIGMDSAELPRIFEPYYRGRSARESGATGSGLGMSVVKEIVEDHGGTVEVTSALGRGTTVQLALPRHTPEGEN